MLIEILELAAALEWLVLGVLVYLKARSLSRRLDALCGKLPIGPGPDPAGKKGPWGICPECGAVGYCYWDEKNRYAHVYGVRAQGQRHYPLNAWPESPATL